MARRILLGEVRAEMFLQESTGQGWEIATREEPPNVGSINSSSNLFLELRRVACHLRLYDRHIIFRLLMATLIAWARGY